jgi:aryl-alcohol dehydrogenase-like predicted oxidoreductase
MAAESRLCGRPVEAGVTHIDTADVYGLHSNELLIREALHPYPEHLVIVTKGGFVRGGPGGDRPALIDELVREGARRMLAETCRPRWTPISPGSPPSVTSTATAWWCATATTNHGRC